jgi:cytochrome c5
MNGESSTMRLRWLGTVVGGVAAVALAGAFSVLAVGQEAPATTTAAAPADPATCQGLLGDSGRLPGVLRGVPRYGSTYVLVVPQRLAERVPNAAAPGVKDLEVGVQSNSAGADVARALGITKVREYGSDSAPAQALQDVKDGKLDAAVLWAPLAGLAVIELGMDAEVSAFAVDKPRAVPSAFAVSQPSSPAPCSLAIQEQLDVSGVLPAELLVPVDVREILASKHVPPYDQAEAVQGGTVFNQTCARCHGQDAVADPHGLAPVDLRISITRFSFPGFTYIVLNGRPVKSMPPFRGTVTDEQVRLIYQYLKARSKNLLSPPGTAAAGSTTHTEVSSR